MHSLSVCHDIVFIAKVYNCFIGLKFLLPLHSGLVCINLAHFGGNFWELKKSKDGQEMVQKGAKRTAKGTMKSLMKVQIYHKTAKKCQKNVQKKSN